MNNFMLVGRLVSKPILEENSTTIILAVNRSFKNVDGVYETDFISINLLSSIAENTCEYCKKGDVIGVKGRIAGKDGKMSLIADRITFLSSKKENVEE